MSRLMLAHSHASYAKAKPSKGDPLMATLGVLGTSETRLLCDFISGR